MDPKVGEASSVVAAAIAAAIATAIAIAIATAIMVGSTTTAFVLLGCLNYNMV
jgi:hypothetical protein